MSAARPKTRRQPELSLSLSKRCRPRTLPAARLILRFAIIRRRAATYTSPSWGYSLGPYTAGSAPRGVIGSPTPRSRGTFRCPAGSSSVSERPALRWRSVAPTCRCTSRRSAPGRGAEFFRALSRTRPRCSNGSPRRCRKPPAHIGSSCTATCGEPRAYEPLWIGCNRYSEANETASLGFVDAQRPFILGDRKPEADVETWPDP